MCLDLDTANMSNFASCLVSVDLEMLPLRAVYLEAQGGGDALEAVLVPLLRHDAADVEWLRTPLLGRNVDEVKLLRPINLGTFGGKPALKLDLMQLLMTS